MNYYERVLERIEASTYINYLNEARSFCDYHEIEIHSELYLMKVDMPQLEPKYTVKFKNVDVPLSETEKRDAFDKALDKYHRLAGEREQKILEEL